MAQYGLGTTIAGGTRRPQIKRLLDVFGVQQNCDEVCSSQRIIDDFARHDSAISSNLAQNAPFPSDLEKQLSLVYLRVTRITYSQNNPCGTEAI